MLGSMSLRANWRAVALGPSPAGGPNVPHRRMAAALRTIERRARPKTAVDERKHDAGVPTPPEIGTHQASTSPLVTRTRALGRVGAHLHRPSDQAGVVAALVAESDFFGQSGDGGRGLIGEAPPVGGSENSVLFRPLDCISGTPARLLR